MWIFLNNAFLSIVTDRNSSKNLLVRGQGNRIKILLFGPTGGR